MVDNEKKTSGKMYLDVSVGGQNIVPLKVAILAAFFLGVQVLVLSRGQELGPITDLTHILLKFYSYFIKLTSRIANLPLFGVVYEVKRTGRTDIE
ncbi:hypothetical protein BK123_05360 [Paenibacillus lautus]|uniref:Uncharacterized protein n=1 Tax=Paenibacillus lautus TaxID=1401 RepID=A0A1R1B4S6_PAELA|nr:hypothetical protein BK123_05360 [Paenibacillus lautus]